MELFRTLIIIAMITLIALLLLKSLDLFVAWYENKGKPEISKYAREIAEEVNNATGQNRSYNPNDYDIYSKSKTYFQPLDIALVIAFLSALAGAFIYNRERT